MNKPADAWCWHHLARARPARRGPSAHLHAAAAAPPPHPAPALENMPANAGPTNGYSELGNSTDVAWLPPRRPVQ